MSWWDFFPHRTLEHRDWPEVGQVSAWEHPAALRADSQLLLQRALLMPLAQLHLEAGVIFLADDEMRQALLAKQEVRTEIFTA